MRGSPRPNWSVVGFVHENKYFEHALSGAADIVTAVLQTMRAYLGLSLLATSATVAAGQGGMASPASLLIEDGTNTKQQLLLTAETLP